MNELKKINIKNRGCYCSDDIIRIKDLDLNKVLVYGKQCQYIFIYRVV